ncbi:hypothetical protein KKH05_00220 [Patescibacteria group bacterium]|nr:hypothetical protein [Patescibacteria group bacterium]
MTGETNECEKCIYNDTTTNPYLDIPASLNLPYGTVVFVQVRAGAPGIGGLWSEVISFTTPDAPNIVIYDWIKGLWTTCNPVCGTSCEESRLITCADSNGNIVADSNCTETKPDTTRSHDGPACACDSENLNLCNSDDCSAAGGYWYNDTCNDASEGESEENCLPTSGVVYHFYHYLTEEMEIDAGRCLGRVNSEYNELENDEVIVFENVVIEYNRQDYMVYWETRSVYFNTRGIPDSSGNSVTIYSPRPDGGYTKGNLVIGWVKNYEQEGASEGWDIQVEFSNDKGVIYNTKSDYLFFGESDHFEVTPELHDRIFSGQSSQAYVYVQVIAYDKKTQEIKLYSNRVRFTIHPESDGGEEVPVIFGKASVQDFIVKYNNGELSTQSDKGMSRVKVDAAMYEGTPIAKLGKRIINGDIFKNVYVYAESVLLASVWAKSSAVHKTWKLNLGLSAVSTTGEKLTAWLYGMVYKIGTRAAVAFVVCDFAAENYCSKSLWNGLKWAYFKLADEVDESIAFTVFKEDFVYFFQGTPEYLSENLDKWRLYRLRLYLTTNGQQVSEFLEVAIDDTYGFIETALQRKQIDDPDVIGIADRFIKLTGYKPVEPWVEPLIEDEKYTISINPGWNLVSAYSVIDPAEVFTGVVSVWKWKENTWAYYLPEILPPGFETLPFETLKTINPGEGFWVNSEIATSYTLSVEIDPNAQTVLAPGWNLIGTADDSPITVDWLESKYDNIVSIWKWVDNNWEVYLPQEEDKGETYAKSKGFQALNVINLGEGFWVDCE